MYLDPEYVNNKDYHEKIKYYSDCCICEGIVINPLQCLECENCFCEVCISKWICKPNQTCPWCRVENFEVKEASRIVKNGLKSLEFTCPENNCSDIVTYDDMSNHSFKCKNKAVECPMCLSKVEKSKINRKLFEDLKVELEMLKGENHKLKNDLESEKKNNIDNINFIRREQNYQEINKNSQKLINDNNFNNESKNYIGFSINAFSNNVKISNSLGNINNLGINQGSKNDHLNNNNIGLNQNVNSSNNFSSNQSNINHNLNNNNIIYNQNVNSSNNFISNQSNINQNLNNNNISLNQNINSNNNFISTHDYDSQLLNSNFIKNVNSSNNFISNQGNINDNQNNNNFNFNQNVNSSNNYGFNQGNIIDNQNNNDFNFNQNVNSSNNYGFNQGNIIDNQNNNDYLTNNIINRNINSNNNFNFGNIPINTNQNNTNLNHNNLFNNNNNSINNLNLGQGQIIPIPINNNLINKSNIKEDNSFNTRSLNQVKIIQKSNNNNNDIMNSISFSSSNLNKSIKSNSSIGINNSISKKLNNDNKSEKNSSKSSSENSLFAQALSQDNSEVKNSNNSLLINIDVNNQNAANNQPKIKNFIQYQIYPENFCNHEQSNSCPIFECCMQAYPCKQCHNILVNHKRGKIAKKYCKKCLLENFKGNNKCIGCQEVFYLKAFNKDRKEKVEKKEKKKKKE